jgi:hypothetical protein
LLFVLLDYLGGGGTISLFLKKLSGEHLPPLAPTITLLSRAPQYLVLALYIYIMYTYINTHKKNNKTPCLQTDLLVGLVSVMIDMIWRTTVTWSAGPIACKVVKYLQVTYNICSYIFCIDIIVYYGININCQS